MIFWYRGFSIDVDRENGWANARGRVRYAGEDTAETGDYPAIGFIHGSPENQRMGEAVKMGMHSIDGLIGPPPHNNLYNDEIIWELKLVDLVCTMRQRVDSVATASETYESCTVQRDENHAIRRGEMPTWKMPREIPLPDAIDLLIARNRIREFQWDYEKHDRIKSRYFYTAWILNGRKPGMP